MDSTVVRFVPGLEYKIRIFLLLLFATATYAAEYIGQRIEVFATQLDSNQTMIHAHGDVLVLYQDYYLSANEMIYDREKEELELKGRITVMKGADYHVLGEYAKLNLVEKEQAYLPFYMVDKSSQV